MYIHLPEIFAKTFYYGLFAKAERRSSTNK